MTPAISTAGPYRASSTGAIRQGEIVSGIAAYERILEGEQKGEFVEVVHPFAIVVSQDCDLDWDYKSRSLQLNNGQRSEGKEMPSVLLCMVVPASETQSARPETKPRETWNRIRQNKDERYQFLEQVPLPCDLQGNGLPEFVVDFKRYFAIPTADLYDQVQSSALRRVVLNSPYLEHFSSRFVYYQGRVALPNEHHSVP